MTTNFDLQPDPRVLQMLGEINLDQWKCVAELVDNSIDAFINARRDSVAVGSPQVAINLPTLDRDDAAVVISDNGPGMSAEQLESAVRAGWSGNNPLDNLGLYGMGFNIATARLGAVTEVYTTRAGEAEWTGLRIDLAELRRTRSYHTPRLTRVKPNPAIHGTEIKVHRLKADQRAYFARSANLSKVRRQLARVYAPLLLSPEQAFALEVNGQPILPRRHCHWDPERSVQHPDGRPVHAVEQIDLSLTPRRYCTTCMVSFTSGPTCPTGAPTCSVVEISRRLRGWIGLQRYLHEEDFGIDLVRNGRVIEPLSKDLFVWTDGERPEREYPIDDPRNRGRFIGEIHLDHCRVSYTKDRFERDDPAWREMMLAVRGEGPLQPNKARSLSYGPQEAVLNRLFQVFRRSSPQGKTARWSRILVVKNNERAIEMATAFEKGDAAYQTDEKWYALVEEEDRAIVGGGVEPTAPGMPAPVLPEGFIDEPPAPMPFAPRGTNPTAEQPGPTVHATSKRQRIEGLSRTYAPSLLKHDFNVEAFATAEGDPDVPRGAPWTLTVSDAATRTHVFLFVADHAIFRSITMTPLDALLLELALRVHEFLRDSHSRPVAEDFATVLADLRSEYGVETALDALDIIALADATLREIALSIARDSDADRSALFASLTETAREAIRRKVASTGASTLHSAVEGGEFLASAPPAEIRTFVRAHPELFFDGKLWDQPYASLDYGSAKVDAEARARVLERFDAYIADAVWLSSQSARDLERQPRDELMRATLSLRLLRADGTA